MKIFRAACAVFMLFAGQAQAQVTQGPATPTTSIGTSNPANSVPNTYNMLPIYMQNAMTALADSRVGGQRARWCMIGDSTTAGYTTLNTYGNGVFTTAAPYVFTKLLNATSEFPARIDTNFANGLGAIASTYDTRVSYGAGWTTALGWFRDNSDTSNYSFTPQDPVTNFVLYYWDNTSAQGTASFTYAVDGGSATTVNVGATGVVKSIAISAGSLGSHTLTINRVSGSVQLGTIEAYNSAVNDISIFNLGFAGSTTSTWQTTQPSGLMALALKCSLYTINLTINDDGAGTSPSAAQANLQGLITAIQAIPASVVLIVPNPQADSGNVTDATQLAYEQMIIGLGQSNNIPVLDLYARYGGIVNANNMTFVGGIHPSIQGYDDIARFEYQSIMSILGR